jgi:hypothetical protein
MKVTIHEKEPSIIIVGLDQLDEIIAKAGERAKSKNFSSVILLNDDNDNQLGLAVGGNETVLTFTYSHGDPPYYVSKGKLDVEEPVFTCFLLFEHHTEFLRKWVIPVESGIAACHQFYNTGGLPSCIEWVEV